MRDRVLEKLPGLKGGGSCKREYFLDDCPAGQIDTAA